MARDANDLAVVELGSPALRVLANVMSVKSAVRKVATATLTFEVSSDEKLSDLARRETAAAVKVPHFGFLSGSHRIRT